MVLPNSNSMSQQRWQQKPNRSQNRSNKSNKGTAKKTHSSSSINTISNSSSVTELPETFGLPSNQSSKSGLLSKHQSSTNLEKSEITIEDYVKSPPKSDDIEIISEINSSQSADDLNFNLKNYIKNYSLKNLNLPIATKPQSNFVSNFNLIDQLIKKNEFYTNKLKRCKPYSNIKANQIITMESDDSDDDDTGLNTAAFKTKKLILIDDSNEEMHKPWITPELIKLIKHRNLLQSKLHSESETNNPELMKKFKNLRNKVTKLVKKARKEYLTKYIQESKENKIKLSEENKPVTNTSNQETKTQQECENKSPGKESSGEKEPTLTPLASTSNQNVNEITKKMNTSGSFLKDSSTLMMSLYTNYFNEYMQQYTKQQQKAQELAAKINEKNEDNEAYDSLKKQAAVYAQQQLVIQQQLEKSLLESSQQLIQEIAEAAAATANQPFVLNQFSQQHHMHHHMHLGAQIGQQMMPQAAMMTLVPPPPPSSNISQANQIGMQPKVYY